MTIGELSARTGVPRETIRRYERLGLIAPARRGANGYRHFEDAHIAQTRLARLAFRRFLTRGLRAKTIELLTLSAQRRADACLTACAEYAEMVAREEREAFRASEALDALIAGADEETVPVYTRGQAAAEIGSTVETVRGWERAGLFGAPRPAYARVRFSKSDLNKMRVVRLLTTRGYSMQAVLEALSDGNVLRSPEIGRELISIKDRWLETLADETRRAREMTEIARQIAG